MFGELNEKCLQHCLAESDFLCVRDLYSKIKHVICDPAKDQKLKEFIDDDLLFEVCMMIDHTFEVFVTDNPVTTRLFSEMTALSKCLNPPMAIDVIAFNEGFRPHHRELTNDPTQRQQKDARPETKTTEKAEIEALIKKV